MNEVLYARFGNPMVPRSGGTGTGLIQRGAC
jgi:hypothetical protein